jgi:hypothetical protein
LSATIDVKACFCAPVETNSFPKSFYVPDTKLVDKTHVKVIRVVRYKCVAVMVITFWRVSYHGALVALKLTYLVFVPEYLSLFRGF